MVNTLTWRDTAQPNFGTSVDAQRLAGQSLNNAFSGASDALGKFHDWQQGQAANALANNLAQFPDAASEATARANGSLFNGVDRSNLTPQALGTVNSNVTQLLSNAADSAKLPYVGPAAAAGINLTNSSSNMNNSSASQTQLQTRLGTEQDADTKAGLGVYSQITGATSDPSVAQGQLEQQRGNLSPKAYAVAEDALNRHYSPGGAGNPSSNPASGAIAGAAASVPMTSPNSDGFRNAIPANFGETSKYLDNVMPNLPDMTGMTNAQKAQVMMPILMKYGEKTNGSMTDANGKIITSPAGAIGAAQVEPGTFGDMAKAHPDITGPITDKDSNIKAGQYTLQAMLDRYNGDPEKALAAYNAGQSRVDKWAAAAPSPLDLENTHKNLNIQAASLARSAQMADVKQNNGSIASQYSTLMKDQTPAATLIEQNRSKENAGSPFNTIDPDLQVQGMTTVRNLAAKMGVTDLSDATVMGLLKQYGSFHKAGAFTPDTNTLPLNWGGDGGVGGLGYSPGRDSIAIHDPSGLKADLAKMQDPDTLLQQNARTAGLASLSNAVADATAKEQASYTNLLNLQRDKTIHPGRDLKPATDLYNDTAAAVKRAMDALKAAASGPSPSSGTSMPPTLSPRARPGPPIPSPVSTNSAPATAALAAAVQPTSPTRTPQVAAALAQGTPGSATAALKAAMQNR